MKNFGLILFICFVNGENNLTDVIRHLKEKNLRLEDELLEQTKLFEDLMSLVESGQPEVRSKRAAHCNGTLVNPVVFHATLANTITPLGKNQIINYDRIMTNQGNAYDTVTGIFQAPVTGLYQFIATMWSEAGHSLEFELIHDGRQVAAGRTTSTNRTMGVCTAVLQMNSGSRAWLRHKGTDSGYALGGNYASFTGHLIL